MSSLLKFSSVDTAKALLDPPLLILPRMSSSLRSYSALAASWQCQRCDCTNNSAKNKRQCFSCQAWRDRIAPSNAAGITIANAHGGGGASFCSSKKDAPNNASPRSCQPPPHPNRSRCAVCISLPALVTLSACCHHCRRNPLLAPTALDTPSAARSHRAILPPALQHCPRRCCRDARMQKSWDADVDVNVGVDCVCLLLLTIGGAALPRPFPRCSQCSPLPLSSLLSSLSSPRRSCHCCHPYNCGADDAR